MLFKNRLDAAKKLALELQKYKGEDGIVLAIPRGGVPVGSVIAKELGFPLEIFLSKKIGHPMNPEYAVGSVTMDGIIIDNNIFDVSKDYIQQKSEELLSTLKDKYKFFMGDKEPSNLSNKVVIIVDDGIATGNTIKASIQSIQKHHPKKIIVAAPVAPPDTVSEMGQLVDELVVLATPYNFQSIGQFYDDFTQTSDEEVIQLLKEK